MPSILHISDLHRTSEPRVRNDELLAAMSSDAARWETEGIPWPDLVVVSGDVVQGVSLHEGEDGSNVVAQYAEANEFLRDLAAEFVQSDRSRVVVVPGNHDVHWGRARGSMTPLSECPPGVARRALEADSGVRWNWDDQSAYEITDGELYESRYDHFREFRAEFYADLDSGPTVHSATDLISAEYQSLGLLVVGFASWYGNDCFCRVGEIDPAALAESRKLLADSTAPIAVAVWHHSLDGGPHAQDYMDRRAIHRLIDYGFGVGLHGHQHYPGAAPYELRLPNLTSMAVVSAGSLAVGDDELPAGERRQFNIVEIDPVDESITVHVRAMSAAGVFAGSHRDDFGGNTYMTLDLPPPSPARPQRATDTQLLDDATTATALEKYEAALEILPRIVDPSHAFKKRQIKIEALDGLGRHEELLDFILPPQNADEAVRALSLLIDRERFDEADSELEAAAGLLDAATARELAARIDAARMLS